MFKKILLSILFILFSLLPLFQQDNESVYDERIYVAKFIAFYVKWEVYFTKSPAGYYRYEGEFNGESVYFTYEGLDFYNKSLFDEDFYIYQFPVPSLMWTNNRGEVYRLKKRFAPVTTEDREGVGFKYGYARDYK